MVKTKLSFFEFCFLVLSVSLFVMISILGTISFIVIIVNFLNSGDVDFVIYKYVCSNARIMDGITIPSQCGNLEKDSIEYQSIDYGKFANCSTSVNKTTFAMVLTFGEDSGIERVDVGDVEIHAKDCIDSEVYPIKTISKSDLSIDWLEKKAVCQECLVEGVDGKLVSLDYKYCEGELAGHYDKCYMYKFNEYTIEIK